MIILCRAQLPFLCGSGKGFRLLRTWQLWRVFKDVRVAAFSLTQYKVTDFSFYTVMLLRRRWVGGVDAAYVISFSQTDI